MVPPLAVKVAVYAVPVSPPGSDAVEIASPCGGVVCEVPPGVDPQPVTATITARSAAVAATLGNENRQTERKPRRCIPRMPREKSLTDTFNLLL